MTDLMKGDYVLITDIKNDHYLKIGVVEDIEKDYCGFIEKCTVRFGRNEDDKVEFNYHIQYECRVIQFVR